jgi:hypothetical protein
MGGRRRGGKQGEPQRQHGETCEYSTERHRIPLANCSV